MERLRLVSESTTPSARASSVLERVERVERLLEPGDEGLGFLEGEVIGIQEFATLNVSDCDGDAVQM